MTKVLPEFRKTAKEVEWVDCPVCDGFGSIEYQPAHTRDPAYVEDAKCPFCDGKGEVTTEDLEDDPSAASDPQGWLQEYSQQQEDRADDYDEEY